MLLFLCVAAIFNLNGRVLGAGDTVPANYLPFSLIREFDFDLDEFSFLYEREIPFHLLERDGHIVSAYHPWAAVLALPVYILPVLSGISPQSPLVRIGRLEKLSASLIAALSVAVLLLALQRMTDVKVAWLVAVTFALGTSTFSTSSQALWHHGPSQLFLCVMIYCLVRGVEQPRFVALAGLSLASAVICRPLNILIMLPMVAYILHKQRSQFIVFFLATLPPLILFMAYKAA